MAVVALITHTNKHVCVCVCECVRVCERALVLMVESG